MNVRLPAALAALALVAASCTPEYALYPGLQQRKGTLGPVEIVSVASFHPEGRTVDSQRSRQLALAMLRLSADGLASRGYVAANDTEAASACTLDARARYVLGTPAGGGSFAPAAVKAGASYIAGGASLADTAGAAALRRLLRSLRLPGDNGQVPDDSLRQAIDFFWQTGAGRLLVTESYVRTVGRGRQIAQGVVSGILTLGRAPMWERSWTIVNVYLIDCPSGSVLWYDAGMREAGGEPEALEALTASLFQRMP